MSDLGVAGIVGVTAPRIEESEPATTRPWLTQIFLRATGQTDSRLGLCWIGIVALSAIFAPLLANSLPLLVKIDGHWSSPAIRHLSSSDVILLALFPITLIAWWVGRRRSVRFRALCFFSLLVVVGACFAVGS